MSNKKSKTTRRNFRIRLLTIVLLISVVIFAYPVWRICHWLDIPGWLTLIITLPVFLSQLIARVGLRNRTSRLANSLRMAIDFLLGIAPVLLITVLLGEVALLLNLLTEKPVAIIVLAMTAAMTLWGLSKAWQPQVVTVPLSTEKRDSKLRFVQISDVHIGSRTPRFLQKVMHRINSLEADFLCITGDFIDQHGITQEQLEPLAWFDGPIYFCIGNHERYEDLEHIIQRLENLGVEVLRNRSIQFNGLQIIGIDDHEDPQQVAKQLPQIPIQADHYVILLYHRPQGLQAASEHGVDLKLSGHTHNGQIVPFNYAVNKVFEYRKGLYQHENTTLYVNEGTGTWGPTMRLGTSSEITLFELNPC
ncbi:MAG: metallophosphoesterase [Arenicella sp.]